MTGFLGAIVFILVGCAASEGILPQIPKKDPDQCAAWKFENLPDRVRIKIVVKPTGRPMVSGSAELAQETIGLDEKRIHLEMGDEFKINYTRIGGHTVGYTFNIKGKEVRDSQDGKIDLRPLFRFLFVKAFEFRETVSTHRMGDILWAGDTFSLKGGMSSRPIARHGGIYGLNGRETCQNNYLKVDFENQIARDGKQIEMYMFSGFYRYEDAYPSFLYIASESSTKR